MRTLLMRYYSPCLSHFQSKALDLLLADYTVAIFVICFVYSNRFRCVAPLYCVTTKYNRVCTVVETLHMTVMQSNIAEYINEH